MKIVLAIAFLVCMMLVVFAPLFSIAAVNTLFGTKIPMNSDTWWAAFWLTLVVMAPRVSNSK